MAHFGFKISPLCGEGGIRQKSGCFHRGNLLIFFIRFFPTTILSMTDISMHFWCQTDDYLCACQKKRCLKCFFGNFWFHGRLWLNYMLYATAAAIHRLYTTIDRLVQFREIHDRLPTLDNNQRLNQKLVGSDQPLFLAVASGEQIDFFYGSPLIKFKR